MGTNPRRAVIAGVYATRQALSLPDRHPMDLAMEAVEGAAKDAGLRLADIDGAQVDWPGPGGVPGEGSSWARMFGRDLRWSSDSFMDNSGPRGLLKAASAVTSGYADTVIVGGCRMVTRGPDNSPVGAGVPLEFCDVWGGYVVAQFALVAARHMHEFGTTPRQLAEVAAVIRNNGSTNPEAMMYGRGPYTAADVLASRLVATPFHLLDCCIVGEGGAAFVVTTEERARDLPHPPIAVLGGAMEYHQAAYANPPLYREVGRIGRAAAIRAYAMAGIEPREVDVFSIYDPNSLGHPATRGPGRVRRGRGRSARRDRRDRRGRRPPGEPRRRLPRVLLERNPADDVEGRGGGPPTARLRRTSGRERRGGRRRLGRFGRSAL